MDVSRENPSSFISNMIWLCPKVLEVLVGFLGLWFLPDQQSLPSFCGDQWYPRLLALQGFMGPEIDWNGVFDRSENGLPATIISSQATQHRGENNMAGRMLVGTLSF